MCDWDMKVFGENEIVRRRVNRADDGAVMQAAPDLELTVDHHRRPDVFLITYNCAFCSCSLVVCNLVELTHFIGHGKGSMLS
jgi:hypothetical protein